MEIKEKHFLAYIADEKAAINEAQRRIRFVISSGAVDRDREIVEPTAIAKAIKGFSRNPVCLACHQHHLADGMPPVVGSWDTDSFAVIKTRCEMDLVFAATALGETYWQLYKDKHMRAVSIGFGVKAGHEEVKDGLRYYVITEIELYEISCVPVGANRDALSKLKRIGDWQPTPDEWIKTLKETLPSREDIERLTGQIEEIADVVDEIKILLIPRADDDLSMPPAAGGDPSAADAQQADPGQTLEQIAKLINQFKD